MNSSNSFASSSIQWPSAMLVLGNELRDRSCALFRFLCHPCRPLHSLRQSWYVSLKLGLFQPWWTWERVSEIWSWKIQLARTPCESFLKLSLIANLSWSFSTPPDNRATWTAPQAKLEMPLIPYPVLRHADEKKVGTPKLAYARWEDRCHLDSSASKKNSRATTLQKALKIIRMIFETSRFYLWKFRVI